MKKLQDFMKVVNTLSAEEFAEQFPHPILFYSERPGAIEDFARTRMVESPSGGRIDRFSRQVLDLVVLLPNPHTNREFPRKILIGRDQQRDFVIGHNTVSARHATLLLDEQAGQYMLVDAGSTNGTFLRGRQLKSGRPARLRDGDVVTLGKVDLLYFSNRGAYRYLRQFQIFSRILEQQR